MTTILTTVLTVVCAVTSGAVIILVLAHRGSGGGLSDLLGGSDNSLGSSASANRNLTRLSLLVTAVWTVCVVGLALMAS